MDEGALDMFGGRKERERKEIEAEALRRLREEKIDAEVQRRKAAIADRAALPSTADRFLYGNGRYYLLIAVIAAFVGWQLGVLINQVVFWVLCALLTALAVYLRTRYKWNAKSITFASVAFIATYSGSAMHDGRINDARLAAQAQAVAAERQQAHQREAVQNHDRRLAWNLAHPLEIARLRSETRAKVATAKLAHDRQKAAAQLASTALSERIDGEAQRLCDNFSSFAPGSVHGCQKQSDTSMTITVDANDYNAFGPQDQKLIRAGYFERWVKVWEVDHPDKRNESDLYLGIKDLVGNDLGFFTFSSARPGFN
jgi:hypothetical protein